MTIRKMGNGKFKLVSNTEKNLGTFASKKLAEERERQVQYFKQRQGPAIVLTKAEIDARIADPPGLALYLKLRVEHETRPEPFAVDRRALAPLLGWSPGRVNAARKRLEDRGDLRLTSKGKATQMPDGTWKNTPKLYALNRKKK